MPIYEYSCSRCEETIEVIQKMSDPELKKHEGCGGTLTKLLSIPSVQMKEDYGGVHPTTAKHPSFQQQMHNERKHMEKQKKSRPIISSGKGKK